MLKVYVNRLIFLKIVLQGQHIVKGQCWDVTCSQTEWLLMRKCQRCQWVVVMWLDLALSLLHRMFLGLLYNTIYQRIACHFAVVLYMLQINTFDPNTVHEQHFVGSLNTGIYISKNRKITRWDQQSYTCIVLYTLTLTQGLRVARNGPERKKERKKVYIYFLWHHRRQLSMFKTHQRTQCSPRGQGVHPWND